MKVDGLGFSIADNQQGWFRVGDTVTGKVIGFHEGKPVLMFGNGRTLTAVTGLSLKVNETVCARVTDVNGSTVYMKILGDDASPADEQAVENTLLRMNLRSGELEKNLMRFFLKKGMEFDNKLYENLKSLEKSTSLSSSELTRLSLTALKSGMELTPVSLLAARLFSLGRGTGEIFYQLSLTHPEFASLQKKLVLQKSIDSETISELCKSIDDENFWEGLLLGEEKAELPQLEGFAGQRLISSGGFFGYREIPFYITSYEDRVEFYWRKKDCAEGIHSFIICLTLSKLGKLSFQVLKQGKKLNLNVVCSEYLGYNMAKKHLPVMIEKLQSTGYRITGSTCSMNENLRTLRERIIEENSCETLDFKV